MKKLITLNVMLLLLLLSCKEANDTIPADAIAINSTTINEGVLKRQPTSFKNIEIDGVNIAYREAGNPTNPTIVLLHGFPSSSHQYRKVLSELSDKYHLIAPDYPGFGNSDFPSAKDYEYTFDNIATTIDAFLIKKNLQSYALMIQDYGCLLYTSPSPRD